MGFDFWSRLYTEWPLKPPIVLTVISSTFNILFLCFVSISAFIFYSVVASAIFHGVACWDSSISTADRKIINRQLRKASSVLGCALDPVEVVGE